MTSLFSIIFIFAALLDFLQQQHVGVVNAFLFGLTSTKRACCSRMEHGALNLIIEKRLEELGITLPPPPQSRANYDLCCYVPSPIEQQNMSTMYLSGHLPIMDDGTILTGCCGGGGKTIEEGQIAARQTALNLISTMKNQLGDLDRVEKVVKVFGIVNSHTDFKYQHLVMDGCSDTFMEVFGKSTGYHARSAIGTNTLPLDITVEIEAIVLVKPE